MAGVRGFVVYDELQLFPEATVVTAPMNYLMFLAGTEVFCT